MNLQSLYRLRLGEDIKVGDTTPMMVFPIGEWHSDKYPSLPLTEELANELIANFEAGVLGTEPVVDSSGRHDTSAPAAGWVKRVYLASYEEGDVTGLALWADVKWTELGATLLTDDQYKYGSVEIGPVVLNDSGETVDNVLRSLTLTNTPVLRLMPDVQNAADKQRVVATLSLSEFTLAEPGSVNALRDDLERAIGGGWVCDFGPDWVVYESGSLEDAQSTWKALYAKTDQGITLGQPVEVKRETTYVPVDSSPAGAQSASSVTVAAGKDAEGLGAHLSEGDAAKKGAEIHMKTVCKAFQLSEDADEAAILAEVTKLAEHDATETKRADDAETKLTEIEQAKRAGEVEVELTEIEKVGNLTPGEKPDFLKLAVEKPEVYAAKVEERKALKPGTKISFSEIGSGSEGGGGGKRADVELAEKTKARMSKDSVTYPVAMGLVLSEDPDLKTRYEDFQNGKEG